MYVIWEKAHWQGDWAKEEKFSREKKKKTVLSVIQKAWPLWETFLEKLSNQRIVSEMFILRIFLNFLKYYFIFFFSTFQ